MKRVLSPIALLLLCYPLFAKARHAPLPDAVMQAKTIYLVNHTGRQATLDSAYAEFQKWGRLGVAETPDADLKAIFSREGNGGTRMDIFVKGETDAVFEAMEANISPGGVAGLVIHDSSAKHCVERFQEAFRAPVKPQLS